LSVFSLLGVLALATVSVVDFRYQLGLMNNVAKPEIVQDLTNGELETIVRDEEIEFEALGNHRRTLSNYKSTDQNARNLIEDERHLDHTEENYPDEDSEHADNDTRTPAERRTHRIRLRGIMAERERAREERKHHIEEMDGIRREHEQALQERSRVRELSLHERIRKFMMPAKPLFYHR